MPRPAIIWLIADTHLYHDKIVVLSDRPSNFTQLIISNLRRLIAEQDTLIHLGDVILYKHPELVSILDSIKGRKILVMGNHDRKSKGWYMRAGFASAMDMMVWGNILFSHKPVEHLPDGVKYNIHGHFHNDEHRKGESWYDPAVHKLLAIENTDYQPIKLQQFLPEADVT